MTKYGYLIHNITGIRAHIVTRLDGKGYDITRRTAVRYKPACCLLTCFRPVGPHSVRAGQLVLVDDQMLVGATNPPATTPRRVSVINLQFFVKDVNQMFQTQEDIAEGPLRVNLPANTASFGRDPSLLTTDYEPIGFGHQDGVRLVQDHSNRYGCQAYQQTYSDEVLLADRGECTFLMKLLNAKEAGASGVVVINDNDARISPSIDEDEKDEVGDAVDDVVLVILTKTGGKAVTDMIKRTRDLGVGQVMFTIDPESRQVGVKMKPTKIYNGSNDIDKLKDDIHKVLYLNGHALVNTRLVV